MDLFKDLKSWLLIYFPQETGSASFSIFLGGPWKWKSPRQKCSQRKPDGARFLRPTTSYQSRLQSRQRNRSAIVGARLGSTSLDENGRIRGSLVGFHGRCRSREVQTGPVKHGRARRNFEYSKPRRSV